MKTSKIIYWVSTGLLSVLMLITAFKYLTNEDVKAAFVHLGFPDYFRIQLGLLKLFGAIALIIPQVPGKLKLVAYFGFALTFISAFIAHFVLGDPTSVTIMPIFFLILLGVSYYYHNSYKTVR